MKFEEIMELNSLDKIQLVQLCNALYELLQQRPAQAPAFTFIPSNPPAPYVPPFVPVPNPWPYGPTIISSNERTQQ